MSTSQSRRYHHRDLRTALFQAALDLLTKSGPDALSLRAVARLAGVSAMAPYRHYPDKQALLAAVATFGFQELGATLRQADQDAATGGAVVAQAIAYVRFALANAALFHLMFDPKRVGSHPDLNAAGDATYSVLSDRVAAEAKQGEDHEARSVGCWALVHGLACLFLDGQIRDRISGPDDDVTRRVVEATLKDTC